MNRALSQGSERVMVISPHPDDIDFGCSGTIAKWSLEQKRIIYVICTSGDKGTDNPQLKPQTLANMREDEQRAAAGTVGVEEVIFLRLKDGELENNTELRRLIVRMMRIHRPDTLLSIDPSNNLFENPYVSHRDHRETALAAFDSIYPAARNPNFFPELLEEGLSPHFVRSAYFFATPKPNTWVDITETLHTKMAALRCHKSQMNDFENLEIMIRKQSREVGEKKGFKYAEAFRYVEFPP